MSMFPDRTVTLSCEDWQAVILALSELSIQRPGWVEYLATIATQMGGEELYDTFRRNHSEPIALQLSKP